MDLDMKWVLVWVLIVFTGLGVYAGWREYQQNQCKTSLTWAGRSADEIVKICK